jgi:hypothetical protein
VLSSIRNPLNQSNGDYLYRLKTTVKSAEAVCSKSPGVSHAQFGLIHHQFPSPGAPFQNAEVTEREISAQSESHGLSPTHKADCQRIRRNKTVKTMSTGLPPPGHCRPAPHSRRACAIRPYLVHVNSAPRDTRGDVSHPHRRRRDGRAPAVGGRHPAVAAY